MGQDYQRSCFSATALWWVALVTIGCADPDGLQAGDGDLDAAAPAEAAVGDSHTTVEPETAAPDAEESVGGSAFVAAELAVVGLEGYEQSVYVFQAQFAPREYVAQRTCTLTEQGSCSAVACEGVWTLNGTVSAGAVQVSGGAVALTLLPDSSGSYEMLTGNDRLWSGGETLRLSASGQEAPGFDATLVGASRITLTAPAVSEHAATIVPTATELSIAWTGGSFGKVFVALVQAGSDWITQVRCAYEATAGSGVVPIAMLAHLTPGLSGDFWVTSGDRQEFVVGGWTVTVLAEVAAVLPSGAQLPPSATFE